MEFNDITTIEKFRRFVGKHIFTIEFFKKPETAEEKAIGRGAYRKMNAMLGVSGNAKKGVSYVKNTQPITTAKRQRTNAKRLQIGCFEMRGTSDRVEDKNYRVLTIDPTRCISLTANGIQLVNPQLKDFVNGGE